MSDEELLAIYSVKDAACSFAFIRDRSTTTDHYQAALHDWAIYHDELQRRGIAIPPCSEATL